MSLARMLGASLNILVCTLAASTPETVLHLSAICVFMPAYYSSLTQRGGGACQLLPGYLAWVLAGIAPK